MAASGDPTSAIISSMRWWPIRGCRAARNRSLRTSLEEQFGSAGVDVDVAEFVEAEQVETAVAADDAGKDAFVGGFDEFVDKLGGGDVADASSLFAGCQAQSDEEMPWTSTVNCSSGFRW